MDNLVKGVQCYEPFGGIELKNHAFSFHLKKTIAFICKVAFLSASNSSEDITSYHFALLTLVVIIIMVIFKCYFSREHIALSNKKWCEHRIRKSTAHDEKSYLK